MAHKRTSSWKMGGLGLACLAALSAQAAPVTITTPFMNLENRAVNSLGFGAGQFLRFGANSVVPNGANGTTGLATSVNPVTGANLSRVINFNPGPVIPNFFSRYLTDDPSVRGNWTLTFTNTAGGSTNTASTQVSLDPNAQQAKFVDSITLSGTSQNPTFTWAPPAGTTVNGYRVNIYDKALVSATNNGQVSSRNLQPGVTSYTVTGADFSNPNYQFTTGHNYSIEISLIQTKDNSSANLANNNLQAIARAYADFTPTQSGGQNVILPVTLSNGAFQFNVAVVPGQTYFIDPLVAVGYDYATGTGDPNILSVDLPDAIGDGLYDIFGYDAQGVLQLLAGQWNGSQVFSFGGAGVSRFRVTGIETGAGLDPSNATAFITGLTFAAAGKFTGTQTPITVEVGGTVDEPPMLALLALLGGAAAWARRRAPRA